MFDPKTGAVLAGPPPRPLDRLETKIEKGDLYVAYRDFRVGTAEKVAV
jgi:Rieske Fe-S protein